MTDRRWRHSAKEGNRRRIARQKSFWQRQPKSSFIILDYPCCTIRLRLQRIIQTVDTPTRALLSAARHVCLFFCVRVLPRTKTEDPPEAEYSCGLAWSLCTAHSCKVVQNIWRCAVLMACVAVQFRAGKSKDTVTHVSSVGHGWV